MCELEKYAIMIAPLFSAVAAIAAAYAAFAALRANNISKKILSMQRNSILNMREIELLNKALELLKIYDVWCKPGCTGEKINYHKSKEISYETRDEAWMNIPYDLKIILIRLSSLSSVLEKKLSEWEEGFIEVMGDSFKFDDDQVAEKIRTLRDIVYDGLQS
jgi:hypothetical protein